MAASSGRRHIERKIIDLVVPNSTRPLERLGFRAPAAYNVGIALYDLRSVEEPG